jgi:hypothetical protein
MARKRSATEEAPSRTRGTGGARATELHKSLDRAAQKLEESTSLRPGHIVLRLGGAGGGNFAFQCSEGKVRLVESPTAGADELPLVEVLADAETARAIIDGEKDAQKQFFSGGIRVRGDLRYFSDLAVELGLLETPL